MIKRIFQIFPIALLLFNCGTSMKQTGTDGSQAAAKSHTFTKVADVKWAAPRGFDLTMDIYTPDTKKRSYPVIIMYHGGGWLINNKSIMDEGAAYLASHGEYIVCNVNYRLLGDLGNTVTMDEIVSDALGARLWVRENIAKYGGDPTRIIVTGDSAGGHLATMVATQGHRMAGDGDFNPPNYTFRPSYLPADGIKAADASVQAAIISYGAFNPYAEGSNSFESAGNIFWQMGGAQPRGIMGRDYNPTDHAERYKMISPIHLVEAAATRNYPPMLFTVGSKDNLTTPATIQAYMDKLKAAGHDDLTYWVHEGRPHAFLDSGSNAFLGIEFQRDAAPALNYMLDYLNGLFYA